jgi:hypothetical protein
MMTTRGILFSGEMVRRLLANAKWQTRRIVKINAKTVLTPEQRKIGFEFCPDPNLYRRDYPVKGMPRLHVPSRHPEDAAVPWRDCGAETFYCPYGEIGDHLFVREDTWIWCDRQPNGITKKGRPKFRYVPVGRHVVYKADGEKPTNRIDDDPGHMWKFKPGRFMPRWASRLEYELTDIRVQRLQDISEEDAIAEGIRRIKLPGCTERFIWSDDPMAEAMRSGVRAYQMLWESINGPGSWDANPYVWCLSFRRV